jgi:hypothetical protein
LGRDRSQITRRDDDRERQTVQTIVGLPARKASAACVVFYGHAARFRHWAFRKIERWPEAVLPLTSVISRLKPKRLSRVESGNSHRISA